MFLWDDPGQDQFITLTTSVTPFLRSCDVLHRGYSLGQFCLFFFQFRKNTQNFSSQKYNSSFPAYTENHPKTAQFGRSMLSKPDIDYIPVILLWRGQNKQNTILFIPGRNWPQKNMNTVYSVFSYSCSHKNATID